MNRIPLPVPRWTPVFDRIPDEKRRRVLESAKSAFAHNGFAGTNVNHVAAAAGISVGALYKYFRTKTDLFLAIVEEYEFLLGGALDSIFGSEPTFLGRVENLLRAAIASALEDPELIKIYVDCTTEELSGIAVQLSGRIETVSATMYRRMIAEAVASGEVAADIDPASSAYLLDNIFLMIQFSYASTYYRARLDIFVGSDADDPENILAAALRFIRRSFDCRS
ncbi:MAG: TetR/AcrR family transcriptional regulator [Spirochaetia bacterium]|jgi:AcrR family transcriptional regulator|nr:TetR/AcrR family transcriptional regulator [Spirochaetia bacterium]